MSCPSFPLRPGRVAVTSREPLKTRMGGMGEPQVAHVHDLSNPGFDLSRVGRVISPDNFPFPFRPIVGLDFRRCGGSGGRDWFQRGNRFRSNVFHTCSISFPWPSGTGNLGNRAVLTSRPRTLPSRLFHFQKFPVSSEAYPTLSEAIGASVSHPDRHSALMLPRTLERGSQSRSGAFWWG